MLVTRLCNTCTSCFCNPLREVVRLTTTPVVRSNLFVTVPSEEERSRSRASPPLPHSRSSIVQQLVVAISGLCTKVVQWLRRVHLMVQHAFARPSSEDRLVREEVSLYAHSIGHLAQLPRGDWSEEELSYVSRCLVEIEDPLMQVGMFRLLVQDPTVPRALLVRCYHLLSFGLQRLLERESVWPFDRAGEHLDCAFVRIIQNMDAVVASLAIFKALNALLLGEETEEAHAQFSTLFSQLPHRYQSEVCLRIEIEQRRLTESLSPQDRHQLPRGVTGQEILRDTPFHPLVQEAISYCYVR